MERRYDERIVKIPLPATLIREIDEAIVAGLGGYSTRTEFFRDAAEGLLLELKYEPAPAEPRVSGGGSMTAESLSNPLIHVDASEPRPSRPRVSQKISSFEETTLHLRGLGVSVPEGLGQVSDEPLFGMHNRDYPSLWVAFRLAALAMAGPVPFDSFVAETTAEAWGYAEALGELESEVGQKLTALFPTNRDKPQAAAQGFKAFAIGSIARSGQAVQLDGPLFSWRVCHVDRSPTGELRVGITSSGWRVLSELDGISAALPHDPAQAEIFLSHLREHARGEWWGFQTLLRAIAEQPNRLELVRVFQGARPDWTASVAATNAQGYVARAREWGLVEPKQIAGGYRLSEFGERYLKSIDQASNGGK